MAKTTRIERWAREQLERHLLEGEQLGPLAVLIPRGDIEGLISSDTTFASSFESTPAAVVAGLTSGRRLLLMRTIRGIIGTVVRENRGVSALTIGAVIIREERRSLEIEDAGRQIRRFRKRNKSRQFPTQARFFEELAAAIDRS